MVKNKGGNYPFIDGFKFAVSNFRTKDLLYWSAWLTASNIAFSLVEKLSGYSVSAEIAKMLANGGRFDFGAYFISWSILLVSIVVSMYISARAILSAMKVSKLKAAATPSLIGWLWLQIYKLAINMACWHDKKLLLPAAAFGAVGGILFIAGMQFYGIIVFLLAVFLWEIAFLIHAVRTSFSVYMFLEGERNAKKVVGKSSDVVKGKTIEVFAAQLFAMLALFVPLLFVYGAVSIGIWLIASKAWLAGLSFIAIGAGISVFTLALQQALSANIWAFFRGKP